MPCSLFNNALRPQLTRNIQIWTVSGTVTLAQGVCLWYSNTIYFSLHSFVHMLSIESIFHYPFCQDVIDLHSSLILYPWQLHSPSRSTQNVHRIVWPRLKSSWDHWCHGRPSRNQMNDKITQLVAYVPSSLFTLSITSTTINTFTLCKPRNANTHEIRPEWRG